jgi:iron complex transport system substrate-binding protein
LSTERQRLIKISYDGIEAEDAFRADLIVGERVIVEVKSVDRVARVHAKQLLTYLRLTNLRVGLLLNFGAETMKEGIERVVNDYRPSRFALLRVDRPRDEASQPSEPAPDTDQSSALISPRIKQQE